jgi:prolyl 4-hydroxylase
MKLAGIVFAALFVFGGAVLLLGHFHNASVSRHPGHQDSRSAIPKIDPVPPTHSPAPATRPRPVLEGVPPGTRDVMPVLGKDPKDVPWLPSVTGRDRGMVAALDGVPVGWQVISPTTPRALRVFDALSSTDCDDLVAYAKGFMERSMVISSKFNGQSEQNQVRTSTGMFMASTEQRANPINVRLHQRAMALMGLGEDSWVEATQILRYEPGQYYRPHTDYFDVHDTPNLNRGGQRLITMLVWLTDVETGGDTAFPLARPRPVSAQPAKGQAVLFYDVDEHGVGDPASTHGGEPPKPGSEKWVAVLWCHGRTFT